MDRFGLGYVVVLIALIVASTLLGWGLVDPGEPAAAAHSLSAGPPPIGVVSSGPPPAAGTASTAAVVSSDGRTYRVLVGSDAAGRTWSAAIAVDE